MTRVLIGLILVSAISGSRPEDGYERPRVLTKVRGGLREISGMAASSFDDELLWVHQDSGDSPTLYGLNTDGKLRAQVLVDGAKARDWEDISIGLGPPAVAGVGQKLRRVIYIADTGDNQSIRNDVCIYRIPEPSIPRSVKGAKFRSKKAEVFPFEYEDGPRDCESIVAAHDKPEVFLLTKEFGQIGVYRLLLKTPGVREKARRIASLRFGSKLTGATLSPDGTRLALRFYLGIRELRSGDGKPILGQWATTPVTVSAPIEPQGEAITYTRDGRALLTASEGLNVPIYRIDRVGKKKEKESKP